MLSSLDECLYGKSEQMFEIFAVKTETVIFSSVPPDIEDSTTSLSAWWSAQRRQSETTRWDTARSKIKNKQDSIYEEHGRKEMFYLTMHSTHFIYGYMESDIWLRTILIVRKETCSSHIGYSFRLTARVLLYAPFQ